MVKLSALLLVCGALWSSVQAAEIYQWTDESGRTHVSDRPPAKGPFKKIDSGGHELTEAQRKDAASNALSEKARRDRTMRAMPVLPVPSEALPPSSLSEVPATETECERMTRLYRESEACFGPYKQWNGSTKAEAFEQCEEVPEPSIKCGYVK